MPLFPMFVDLSAAPGLLIGGGKETVTKTRRLLPFHPRLTVFAPGPVPELAGLPGVEVVARAFRDEDLEPIPGYVIVAGADQAENRRIADLCRSLRIPVNTVDDPAYCTFQFPALITEGEVSIGISTAGASPAAAVLLKERIRDAIPDDLEHILPWAGELTRTMRREIPDMAARTPILRAVIAGAFEKGRPLTPEETAEYLQ